MLTGTCSNRRGSSGEKQMEESGRLSQVEQKQLSEVPLKWNVGSPRKQHQDQGGTEESGGKK